jgi:hypothetical protein
LINNPLGVGHFMRGSFYALFGLTVLSTYYLHAWRKLRSRSPCPLDMPEDPDSPMNRPRDQLRYMKVGMILSVICFMSAGTAEAGKDVLYGLVGALMGLCGALAVAMFGVGFVSLTNLWKELILQLRKASIGSLLASIPVALLYLAMGFGAFLLAGTLVIVLVEKLGQFSLGMGRYLLWILITLMFWRLWRSGSHAALMLRLILLISFSAVILAAAGCTLWWVGSQTGLQLVILLSVIGSLNVLFYARFVRDTALMDNLEDVEKNVETPMTLRGRSHDRADCPS